MQGQTDQCGIVLALVETWPQKGIPQEMINAHTALRTATSTIHKELHEHPSFRALLNGSISAERYSDLMAQFFLFYEGLDPLILAAPRRDQRGTHVFDYQVRAPLFAEDLVRMGANLDTLSPAGSQCLKLPSYHSTAALAGALYVVEGSALGGAMMNRALEKVRHTNRVLGRSYWDWCARVGKKRWKATLDYISSTVVDEDGERDSVEAAQATFHSLSEWLEPAANRVKVTEPVAVAG